MTRKTHTEHIKVRAIINHLSPSYGKSTHKTMKKLKQHRVRQAITTSLTAVVLVGIIITLTSFITGVIKTIAGDGVPALQIGLGGTSAGIALMVVALMIAYRVDKPVATLDVREGDSKQKDYVVRQVQDEIDALKAVYFDASSNHAPYFVYQLITEPGGYGHTNHVTIETYDELVHEDALGSKFRAVADKLRANHAVDDDTIVDYVFDSYYAAQNNKTSSTDALYDEIIKHMPAREDTPHHQAMRRIANKYADKKEV